MIFSIKLNIDIDKKYFEDSYYIVLGSILNLIGDNKELKDSILTISNIYKKDHDFFCVKISIYKKENFNLIINKIFDKKEININGKLYKITGIDFNFEIFDEKNIVFKDYKNIELKFKTPTYIKKEKNSIDINQFLPSPDIFLLSAIRKYSKLFEKDLDLDKIRQDLKKNIIVVMFDIRTKRVKVKKNIKAGVVGIIKYEVLDTINIETKQYLYIALKLVNMIGLGTGARMGLGQVGVYFSN